MTKNFPKLMLDTNPQMQEAYKTSSKINAKKLHLGISHSSIKDKEKTLKGVEGKKHLTHRGLKIRINLTSPQRKKSGVKYLVFREKAYQKNRILFPVKQFFKNEVDIKNFSDKQKLKKFVASKLL